MPSWSRDNETGRMIPTKVIWCNHPDHPIPGWTETSSRWVGIERVDKEDRVMQAMIRHCKTYGEDHKRFIVMGDEVHKEDFGPVAELD